MPPIATAASTPSTGTNLWLVTDLLDGSMLDFIRADFQGAHVAHMATSPSCGVLWRALCIGGGMFQLPSTAQLAKFISYPSLPFAYHNDTAGVDDEFLIATMMGQVTRGLEFLHSNDVIHRDIKSGNVLMNKVRSWFELSWLAFASKEGKRVRTKGGGG